jgi:hypothetical protein
MNGDLQQLIDLFNAKVQSFETPAEQRFHLLLPFKRIIRSEKMHRPAPLPNC